MVSVFKTVGVACCGFVLCLGLADIASSSGQMKDAESGKIIKGKVQRIEGDNYIVRNKEDGKEVRLHIDSSTQKNAVGITAGDNIMAKVNDQNHVIAILTDQSHSTIQEQHQSKGAY